MPYEKNVDVANKLQLICGNGFRASITGVTWSGVSRAPIDVSDMDSGEPDEAQRGGLEFIMNPLGDPGQLQLAVHYDVSNPPKNTPYDTPEDIEIRMRLRTGKSTPARIVGKGYIGVDESIEMNLGAKVTGSVTIRFSGVVSLVPAA